MAGSTGGAVAQRGRTRPAVGGSAALLGRSTARGSAGGGRAARAAGGRRRVREREALSSLPLGVVLAFVPIGSYENHLRV
jgi:hypothetical protein